MVLVIRWPASLAKLGRRPLCALQFANIVSLARSPTVFLIGGHNDTWCFGLLFPS
jgi:hypothetical protein